jgi:hypothetical protein
MSTKMKRYQNKLNQLLEMNLSDRIIAIEKDLISGLDEYKTIPALDLGKALEVPLSAVDGSDPDSWSLWQNYKYIEIKPFAELLNEYGPLEIIERLDEERYLEISKALTGIKITKVKVINLLTANECEFIARSIAEENLNNEDGDYYSLMAIYNVISSELCFQAMLDGDYTTLSELKSPYDERDGKFLKVWDNTKKYLYQEIP